MQIDRLLRVGILAFFVSACSAAPSAPPAAPVPTATSVPTPSAGQAIPRPAAVPTLAIGPQGNPPDPNAVPVPPDGSCHIVNGIADHTCTPGLVNPSLTVAQLCAAGFSTTTIRPPVSYTNVLKQRLMKAYGLTQPPEYYELDHELSLEDLGHPYDPRNLWPQPRGKTLPGSQPTGAEPNAEEKDQVETAIHRMICADPTNAANIASLQARLVDDWRQFRQQGIVPDTEPTKEPEP
ncbi:MAG TPA: hypothetical protein VKV73_14765 [Chloroflexota bacterium]|nr:hypothetical protein [Chloroflexota bacterium]